MCHLERRRFPKNGNRLLSCIIPYPHDIARAGIDTRGHLANILSYNANIVQPKVTYKP